MWYIYLSTKGTKLETLKGEDKSITSTPVFHEYLINGPPKHVRQSQPLWNLNSKYKDGRNNAKYFTRCANDFTTLPPYIHTYT